MAKHLGMSNTPVRSAVERLELKGMLSIGPQSRIQVRELTPDEIVDHFEIGESLQHCVTSVIGMTFKNTCYYCDYSDEGDSTA